MQHLPTAGHLLTAMDYALQTDRAQRHRIPCGAMVRYPWDEIPAGWMRCTGGTVDSGKYPDLHQKTGGTLPKDEGWIIKL